MKKSELEQEIASLRKEVEHLREKKQPSHKKPQTKSNAVILDEDLKETLTEFLSEAKKDYDNLSPATTLFLFALGALFGRVLARHKGEH